jgi:predicted nucleotidyltransferase component of viral defense system
MIKEWLEQYQPRNQDEAAQGLREIMQEIALAGLQRSGFFEIAAFYGGTALRVFHGLDRFSEDLDFSLLKANSEFSFAPYLKHIVAEFEATGMQVLVRQKLKTNQTQVDSAFLKSETLWQELSLEGLVSQLGLTAKPNIKIKLEVDTRPPAGFDTEEKLLLKPFSCYVKCFTLPSLFAGKMHALLFRKWQQRVKGRDWYDLEWYIKKGVPLNLHHFSLRAQDSGDLHANMLSEEDFLALLRNKIETVSFERIREDVIRFVKEDKSLKIWSAPYFMDLISHIKFLKQ